MYVRLQKRTVSWLAMALCAPTRLGLGAELSGNRDTRLLKSLAQRVKACAKSVPLLVVTEGWKPYQQAFAQTFYVTEPTGKRGQPRRSPCPQFALAQTVKWRECGRVLSTSGLSFPRRGQSDCSPASQRAGLEYSLYRAHQCPLAPTPCRTAQKNPLPLYQRDSPDALRLAGRHGGQFLSRSSEFSNPGQAQTHAGKGGRVKPTRLEYGRVALFYHCSATLYCAQTTGQKTKDGSLSFHGLMWCYQTIKQSPLNIQTDSVRTSERIERRG